MKRLLMVSCLAIIVGCATSHPPTPTIRVANTPEGLACWRQCEQIYYSCTGGCKPPPSLFIGPACRADCAKANERCQLTCPGATRVDVAK